MKSTKKNIWCFIHLIKFHTISPNHTISLNKKFGDFPMFPLTKIPFWGAQKLRRVTRTPGKVFDLTGATRKSSTCLLVVWWVKGL